MDEVLGSLAAQLQELQRYKARYGELDERRDTKRKSKTKR